MASDDSKRTFTGNVLIDGRVVEVQYGRKEEGVGYGLKKHIPSRAWMVNFFWLEYHIAVTVIEN